MLMFYRYLGKSASYLEYGSGGSTYQASIRPNIKRIVSVESDLEWHNKMKSLINNDSVIFVHCDMETLPNIWGGYPGENSTPDAWRQLGRCIL